MLTGLSVEEIISSAGPWHSIISAELDKAAISEDYSESILDSAMSHLKSFYNPEVYGFYKHIYNRVMAGESSGDS